MKVYLLDTNILLALLLEEENADQIKELLNNMRLRNLYLTDFALHSICVILIREELHHLLSSLINDIQSSGIIQIIQLELDDFPRIVSAVRRYRLDFDDAYQYVSAEKHDLIIISLDKDFDRTERGRKTPAEVLGI